MKKNLLLILALACIFFAGYVIHGEPLKKLDLLLTWHKPPGTNDMVYNIRVRDEGSLIYDYKTWPVLAVDTNVTSHILYHVWENQMFSVSHTNPATGDETTQDIAPVHGLYSDPTPGTNAATPRDVVVDPLAKQSLKFWWNGPTNWQANGGIFNIRYANGPWTGSYNSWPLWSRVTNVLNTIYYNVVSTQFFCITFTNKITGVESGDGVGPIRAQYNEQL